jgi:hypothetical protein
MADMLGCEPMAEYNREDALVYGDRDVWAWVAGMISEDS